MLALTPTQNKIIYNISKSLGEEPSSVAVAYNFVTTEALSKHRAKKNSLQYINVYEEEIQKNIFTLISLKTALDKSILPLKFEDSKLTLVVDDKSDFLFAEELKRQNKLIEKIDYLYGDKYAIHRVLQKYVLLEQKEHNIYEALFSQQKVDHTKIADQIMLMLYSTKQVISISILNKKSVMFFSGLMVF